MELANVNKLILLDLDDTLVQAAEIFIYKTLPDGEEIALTPAEYADENVSDEENLDVGFVTKHILDLYRSKGSEVCVQLLFKLVYNL